MENKMVITIQNKKTEGIYKNMGNFIKNILIYDSSVILYIEIKDNV